MVLWVEACRLRGDDIIIRSPSYITNGSNNPEGEQKNKSFAMKKEEECVLETDLQGLPEVAGILLMVWQEKLGQDEQDGLKH